MSKPLTVKEYKGHRVFYEHPIEIGPHGFPTQSKLREVSIEDLEVAIKLHAKGACPHTICWDQPGWPYDDRWCAVCGESRGSI